MLILTRFCKWMDSPYQDFWIRLAVALFAGHLIVSHGYGFFKVFTVPGYFISLVASAVIALLLFVFVNVVAVQLDRYLPWHQSFTKRFVLQSIVGVLLTVAVAYGLADRLFVYMDQEIEGSEYMKYDFYFICLYIALINSYYYVYAKLKRKRILKEELDHYKNYHRNYAFKQAPANLKDIDLTTFGITPTTVACICRIKGVIRIYNMNGHHDPSQELQEVILKQLPKDDYLILNRFCVIHRLLVYALKEATSRRVAVVLRVPFNKLIPDERKEVSQGNTEIFLKAYHQAD